MNVTTKGRYALQVMLELAQLNENRPVSLKTVADRLNISMKYLEGIVGELKKNGFLESVRGKEGGYRLTGTPEKLSIGGILRCVEDNLAPVSCIKQGEAVCERAGMCRTIPMWMELDSITNAYLDSITLNDLLTGSRWK